MRGTRIVAAIGISLLACAARADDDEAPKPADPPALERLREMKARFAKSREGLRGAMAPRISRLNTLHEFEHSVEVIREDEPAHFLKNARIVTIGEALYIIGERDSRFAAVISPTALRIWLPLDDDVTLIEHSAPVADPKKTGEDEPPASQSEPSKKSPEVGAKPQPNDAPRKPSPPVETKSKRTPPKGDE